MGCLNYRSTSSSYASDWTPRVFFTCHPQDFDLFFQKTSDLFLASYDCTFWYREDSDSPELLNDDDGESELQLAKMQLFVIPVTKRLLVEPNAVTNADFRFALQHNIPVLPLLNDDGIERLYSAEFGDIQYVKINLLAPHTSQIRKLEWHLSRRLADRSTLLKIREAFAARVFLSYRRNDRKMLDSLMRSIHDIPDLTEVAIWYDEYLTPSERFNSEIKTVLEQSDAMILCVTPSVLEDPNYILSTEYPIVRQKHVTVLPVELKKTDHELLYEKYKGLKDLLPENFRTDDNDYQVFLQTQEQLESALTSALREKLTSIPRTPERDYYIGLAYLYGVEAEVNRNRAVSMITSAAERGYRPATEMLIKMYTDGIGVERSAEKRRFWIRFALEEAQKTFEKDPTADNYYGVQFRLLSLIEDVVLSGDTDTAKYLTETFLKEYTEKALSVLEKNTNLSKRVSLLYEQHIHVLTFETFRQIGNIYAIEDDHFHAKEWFNKAITGFEDMKNGNGEFADLFWRFRELGEDLGTSRGLMLDLAHSYCLLGDSESAIKNYDKAIDAYRRSEGYVVECVTSTGPGPDQVFALGKTLIGRTWADYCLSGNKIVASVGFTRGINLLKSVVKKPTLSEALAEIAIGFRHLAFVYMNDEPEKAYVYISLSSSIDLYLTHVLEQLLYCPNYESDQYVMRLILEALPDRKTFPVPMAFDIPSVIREWNTENNNPTDPPLKEKFFAGQETFLKIDLENRKAAVQALLSCAISKSGYKGLAFSPVPSKELTDAQSTYAAGVDSEAVIALDCKTKRTLFRKEIRGTLFTADEVYSSFFKGHSRVRLDEIERADIMDDGIRIKLCDGSYVLFTDHIRSGTFLVQFLNGLKD